MRTTGSITLGILPAVARGAPVDGFRLAYDREGSGPPVVLLHGWPGSRRDYREVVARLAGVAELEALFDDYARPGAFAASIGCYRARAGTLANALAERPPAPEDRPAVPTTVLLPTEDPLFPVAWSDRIDAFLARAQLRVLDGVGHFVPLQAPEDVAGAIRAATGTSA